MAHMEEQIRVEVQITRTMVELLGLAMVGEVALRMAHLVMVEMEALFIHVVVEVVEVHNNNLHNDNYKR